MGRLLTNDRVLNVVIVGHTDTQGAVDTNLALSQRRAEAVTTALSTDYKIDATRLRARGVASFAPVATKRTEVGRARNRRVELIEQLENACFPVWLREALPRGHGTPLR